MHVSYKLTSFHILYGYKGFYELLAEAVGDALGNPKQMDSFIKGMQEVRNLVHSTKMPYCCIVVLF
jgi:hypothetical protein